MTIRVVGSAGSVVPRGGVAGVGRAKVLPRVADLGRGRDGELSDFFVIAGVCEPAVMDDDAWWACGGIAPSGSAQATFSDSGGELVTAAVCNGAWIAVLDADTGLIGSVAVRYSDSSGSTVVIPRPERVVAVEPVAEPRAPCPACSSAVWELVHFIGEFDEEDERLLCLNCGHREQLIIDAGTITVSNDPATAEQMRADRRAGIASFPIAALAVENAASPARLSGWGGRQRLNANRYRQRRKQDMAHETLVLQAADREAERAAAEAPVAEIDATVDGASVKLLAVGTPDLWSAIGTLDDRTALISGQQCPLEGLALISIDLSQLAWSRERWAQMEASARLPQRGRRESAPALHDRHGSGSGDRRVVPSFDDLAAFAGSFSCDPSQRQCALGG